MEEIGWHNRQKTKVVNSMYLEENVTSYENEYEYEKTNVCV